MNREIKFRVWTGKEIDYDPATVEDGSINEEIATMREHYGYVFMQFTGLKDKNGKEIYEGDIVQEDDTTARPTGNPFEVKWDDNRAGWNLLEYGDYFEVIGNINENPELLK